MPSDGGQVFQGRYGDGRTAASRQVVIEVRAEGLAIGTRERGVERLWPYGELEAATPLDHRSSEVIVRRMAPPSARDDPAAVADDVGATLFVADRAFVDLLRRRAAGLTVTRQRWRYARYGLAFVALLALVGLGIWVTGASPSRAVAMMVPQSSWEKVGRQMFAGFTRGHPECTGAEGRAALDRLMKRLAGDDFVMQGYEIKVVSWNLLNAFALPGRQLVLTSRLIETVGSGDELAGVVAHEIGHGLERHPETALVRILGLATIAKIFASGVGDTVSNAALLLVQFGYTRDAEREADRRAIDLMRTARIATRPLATFFNRLKKEEGGGSEPLGGILSTHPGIDERIRTIERVADYPSTPAMPVADLEALRGMCRK
jgi:Zn-dependent protease with chaperone function